MNIMRGDQYPIAFDIVASDGRTKITPEMASEVEIVLNGIRKTFSAEQVFYSNDTWYFPITQQETFGMPEIGRCQVRVKNGDEVIGEYVEPVYMTPSESKVIL